MHLLPMKGQQIYFLSVTFKSVFLLSPHTSTENVQLSGGFFQVSYIKLNPAIKSSMPSCFFCALANHRTMLWPLRWALPGDVASRDSFSLPHTSLASPGFSSLCLQTVHNKEIRAENKALTELRNAALRALESGIFQKAAKCLIRSFPHLLRGMWFPVLMAALPVCPAPCTRSTQLWKTKFFPWSTWKFSSYTYLNSQILAAGCIKLFFLRCARETSRGTLWG